MMICKEEITECGAKGFARMNEEGPTNVNSGDRALNYWCIRIILVFHKNLTKMTRALCASTMNCSDI